MRRDGWKLLTAGMTGRDARNEVSRLATKYRTSKVRLTFKASEEKGGTWATWFR